VEEKAFAFERSLSPAGVTFFREIIIQIPTSKIQIRYSQPNFPKISPPRFSQKLPKAKTQPKMAKSIGQKDSQDYTRKPDPFGGSLLDFLPWKVPGFFLG
jgi:hypothetical protein